jgi:hypothetical protein
MSDEGKKNNDGTRFPTASSFLVEVVKERNASLLILSIYRAETGNKLWRLALYLSTRWGA